MLFYSFQIFSIFTEQLKYKIYLNSNVLKIEYQSKIFIAKYKTGRIYNSFLNIFIPAILFTLESNSSLIEVSMDYFNSIYIPFEYLLDFYFQESKNENSIKVQQTNKWDDFWSGFFDIFDLISLIMLPTGATWISSKDDLLDIATTISSIISTIISIITIIIEDSEKIFNLYYILGAIIGDIISYLIVGCIANFYIGKDFHDYKKLLNITELTLNIISIVFNTIKIIQIILDQEPEDPSIIFTNFIRELTTTGIGLYVGGIGLSQKEKIKKGIITSFIFTGWILLHLFTFMLIYSK
ncbi:MAG: hypothetical protein ACTSPW_19275 [Promethearchaeota archaeon]